MVAEGREEGEMSDLIEFRLSKGVSHDKWRWGAEEEEHVEQIEKKPCRQQKYIQRTDKEQTRQRKD